MSQHSNVSVSDLFNRTLSNAIEQAVKELVQQEVARVKSAATHFPLVEPKRDNEASPAELEQSFVTTPEQFLNFKPRVVELCAGTGGIGLGFKQVGAQVTVACEIDEHARETFSANHRCILYEDVMTITPEQLGQFEILASGFPCQPFSMAGKRKGFKDERGKVGLKILELIGKRLPLCIFLENVTGLLSHKKGRSFRYIKKYLKGLGYTVHHKVLKSSDFNVPQNRKRVFIVAFLGEVDFQFPKEQSGSPKVKDILDLNPVKKLFLNQATIDKLVADRARQKAKGNGFGLAILKPDEPCRTILKSESNRIKCILPVPVGRSKKIPSRGTYEVELNGKKTECYLRYLSVREYARIQGYPEDFVFPVPDSKAYEQLGNAVSIPVIREIAKEVLASLLKLKPQLQNPSAPAGPAAKSKTASSKTSKPKSTKQKVKANDTETKAVFGNPKIEVADEVKQQIAQWQSKDIKNHYSTPNALIQFINEIAPIELDAASSPEINMLHKIPNIFTKKENGLKQEMKVTKGNSVFINPPYDNLLDWSQRIAAQAAKYQEQTFFYLVPARATDTKWYRAACSGASHLVQLSKRLIHNEAVAKKRANFTSVLIVFNGHLLGGKIHEFEKIGILTSIASREE